MRRLYRLAVFITINDVNKVLAILANDATIQIAQNEIDLTGELDGDIVSIEWMPSLFYYR